MVLSCLPGKAIAPKGDAAWAKQLAAVLAAIHDLPGDREPEPWLCDWQQAVAPEAYRRHPVADRIFAALEPWRASLKRLPRTFTHHDFHPGNTLWQRSHLTGVVDWGQAALGWAGYDLAYCRLDVHLQLGPQAAHRLVQAYAAENGRPPEHVDAWDAVAALRALPDVEPWLACYHDLGQRGLNPALVEARHRVFVDAALRRLG
jgi:homoserine kinase type II